MNEKVVHIENGFAVIRSEAFFGAGFNVYRLNDETGVATQISPRLSWFKTQDAAIEWLREQSS